MPLSACIFFATAKSFCAELLSAESPFSVFSSHRKATRMLMTYLKRPCPLHVAVFLEHKDKFQEKVQA